MVLKCYLTRKGYSLAWNLFIDDDLREEWCTWWEEKDRAKRCDAPLVQMKCWNLMLENRRIFNVKKLESLPNCPCLKECHLIFWQELFQLSDVIDKHLAEDLNQITIYFSIMKKKWGAPNRRLKPPSKLVKTQIHYV